MVLVTWTTPLYEGLPKVSADVGKFALPQRAGTSVCKICSEIQCPKMAQWGLKVWSMRAISSLTLVGAFGPPMKASPLVTPGKIPAFSKAAALALMSAGLIAFCWPLKTNGTLRFGSGLPPVQPLSAWPAAANAAITALETRHTAGALGTVKPVLNKLPPLAALKATASARLPP